MEKVPGTTSQLTTGPPRPRSGERPTGRALTRRVVLAMIKRRAAAGLPPSTRCFHTFRATGITAYLSNGRISLEHAQRLQAMSRRRQRKLYDRTLATITVDDRAHRDLNGGTTQQTVSRYAHASAERVDVGWGGATK